MKWLLSLVVRELQIKTSYQHTPVRMAFIRNQMTPIVPENEEHGEPSFLADGLGK